MSLRIRGFLMVGACSLGALVSPHALSWTKTLDFENGVAGEKAQRTVGSFDSAAGGSSYSDEKVLNGALASKLSVKEGTGGFGYWGGIINFPSNLGEGDEVWFSVNTFFPKDFNYDADPWLKFLRLHTKTPSGDNLGYNDWYINRSGNEYPFRFIYEGEQVWTRFGGDSDFIQKGTWENYEMYIRFDETPVDEGGDSLVRVWKNGVLLKEITGSATLVTSATLVDRAHVFTYWNGGAPKTQHMFADDIVVTNDPPGRFDANGNPCVCAGLRLSPPMAPKVNLE